MDHFIRKFGVDPLLTLVLIFFAGITSGSSQSCTNGDLNPHLGVAFSPYVKSAGISTQSDYPLSYIVEMLTLVKNRHNAIATYSMGVSDQNYQDAWDGPTIFSNCIIPRAAATVNLNSGSTKPAITVAQGIYQIDTNTSAQQAEISNAFTAANESNTMFPGTVTRLVFTNEYIVNPTAGEYVLSMLRRSKCLAKKRKLDIGVRINNCQLIASTNPADADMVNILSKIANTSNFVMCNIYPPVGFNSTNTTAALNFIANEYQTAFNGFRAVNSKIEVIIGETGWSSAAANFYNADQYNSVTGLVDFWSAVSTWASAQKVLVFMFEAFDEPWKSQPGWEGEAKLGYWYLDNDVGFVSKGCN